MCAHRLSFHSSLSSQWLMTFPFRAAQHHGTKGHWVKQRPSNCAFEQAAWSVSWWLVGPSGPGDLQIGWGSGLLQREDMKEEEALCLSVWLFRAGGDVLRLFWFIIQQNIYMHVNVEWIYPPFLFKVDMQWLKMTKQMEIKEVLQLFSMHIISANIYSCRNSLSSERVLRMTGGGCWWSVVLGRNRQAIWCHC